MLFGIFSAAHMGRKKNGEKAHPVKQRRKLASYFGIYLVIAGGGKTPELNQKRTSPTCRQA
jgi:hypothetical protein